VSPRQATAVRLVAEDEFPFHGPRMNDAEAIAAVRAPRYRKSWAQWRGKFIRVELPPKVNETWPCGSQWLWRVVDEDRAQIKHSVEGAYVCEHQIEID